MKNHCATERTRTTWPSLFLGVLLATQSVAQAQELARCDFEAGDGSDVSYISPRGSVVEANCHGGRFCGAMRVVEQCDQQILFALNQINAPGEIYAAGWYRFPTNWSWRQSNVCNQSNDFKAFIFETADRRHRAFLNFHDGKPAFIIEGPWAEPAAGWWLQSSASVPTDGQWHYLEVHIDRVPGPNAGHVDVWLDQTKIINNDYTTCGDGPCSPFNEVAFGAYQNFAFAVPNQFFMDDLVVSRNFIGEGGAGRPDAGAPDAGVPDAGVPDAGVPDAGAPDAGVPDAGAPDAGAPDAGAPDAGGGDGPQLPSASGCGCGTQSPALSALLPLILALRWRERRRSKLNEAGALHQ